MRFTTSNPVGRGNYLLIAEQWIIKERKNGTKFLDVDYYRRVYETARKAKECASLFDKKKWRIEIYKINHVVMKNDPGRLLNEKGEIVDWGKRCQK